MARFWKMPVMVDMVDAFRWTGGSDQEEDPTWIREALEDGRAAIIGMPPVMEIKSADGIAIARQGDWVIRQAGGELSACADEAFATLYEPEA